MRGRGLKGRGRGEKRVRGEERREEESVGRTERGEEWVCVYLHTFMLS